MASEGKENEGYDPYLKWQHMDETALLMEVEKLKSELNSLKNQRLKLEQEMEGKERSKLTLYRRSDEI